MAPQINEFKGSDNFAYSQELMVSSGPEVTVHFTSDGYANDKGFVLSYASSEANLQGTAGIQSLDTKCYYSITIA